MKLLQFALEREFRIRQFVTFYRYVSIPMLQQELFPFPTGRRKAQEVMKRLAERRDVKRFRHGREYIYHLEPRTEKWSHWYALNCFHFALLSTLKTWYRVIAFKREVHHPYGRSDALYVIRSNFNDKEIRFFLELDLDSNNPFDKAGNYQMLFDDMSWQDEEWGGGAFPFVAVVSVRPDKVKRIIAQERHGVRFVVLSLDDDPGVILRGA